MNATPTADGEVLGDLRTVSSEGVERPVLPEGMYSFYLADYKLKATGKLPAEQGLALEIFLQVAEGEHQGTKISLFYNIRHANAQTVQISLSQLKNLAEALGLDGEQMLTTTFISTWFQKLVYADVWIEPSNNPRYGDKNRVRRFIHPDNLADYEAGKSSTPDAVPQAPVNGATPPAAQPTSVVPASPPPDQTEPFTGKGEAAAAPGAPAAPPPPAAPQPPVPQAPA